MASSSPSQTPGWHLRAHLRQKSLLQLGQISWYSSVQSSSTFRYRLAHKPLYIFRFKIIEQGQLSYPKISHTISLVQVQIHTQSSKIHSPIQGSELGFGSFKAKSLN